MPKHFLFSKTIAVGFVFICRCYVHLSFRQVQTKCDIIQKSQGRAITKTASYFKQKQQPNKHNIEKAHTGDKVIPDEVNDYSIHIEIKTSDARTTLFLKASFRRFYESVSLANEFFDLL